MNKYCKIRNFTWPISSVRKFTHNSKKKKITSRINVVIHKMHFNIFAHYIFVYNSLTTVAANNLFTKVKDKN